MEFSALSSDLSSLLAPLVLSFARPYGLVVVFPVFTRGQLGQPLKGAIALTLGLPLAPGMTEATAAMDELRGVTLVGYALKEVVVGALVGFVLSFPFWAVTAVGEVLDTQRGATTPGSDDASTGETIGATSAFVGFLAAALFVAAGGMLVVVDALYRSYEAFPPLGLGLAFGSDALGVLASLLDYLLRTAILLSGPILLMLLLTDVAFAFVARSAPKLVSVDTLFSLKNAVFAIGLAIYAVFAVEYVGDHLARVPELGELIGRIAGAANGAGP